MSSIDKSLKRLKTDYVDLYQTHRWDYDTPIEETMEALHDVVKAGKARYIGASSMFSWQFAKALFTSDLHGWTRFVSMQPHYNLIYREEEREMIPLCIDQKIAVIPWSPLARGLLTGNRTIERNETMRAKTDGFGKILYNTDSDFELVKRLSEVAAARELPASVVALAWIMGKQGITSPIIGASKPGHLEDAVAAISVKLTAEEVKQLEELYQPHPILGHS
jgi:aryl-alcohol dehydrogenase-like predicted oxidoreductase